MNWFGRKPLKPRQLCLTVGTSIVSWRLDATDADVDADVRGEYHGRKMIVGLSMMDDEEEANFVIEQAKVAGLSFLTWAAAAAELRVRYPEEGARFARVVQDLIAREQACTQK